MKYIFMAGAPGSKWSSVCKNIYYSPDINRSDFSNQRIYFHSANGEKQLMHLGAYFDPCMEFGDKFLRLDQLSTKECEKEFDLPFSGQGIKIIKSHIFSIKDHILFLKKNWPTVPLILVYRSDDACLGWWVKCGHFDISYPSYAFYKNFKKMADMIKFQNQGIQWAIKNFKYIKPNNNLELCDACKISRPPAEQFQNFKSNDIEVYVI